MMTAMPAHSTSETTQAIVNAARVLFVERGYRATSLREIAAAAGISHPALRRHFGSREAVLAAVIATYERQSVDALDEKLATAALGANRFAEIARHNATMPGYLPLFAGLVGEASSKQHPAHEALRDRAQRLRAFGEQALAAFEAEGVFSARNDVVAEALRLCAAWDGMQVIAQYLPQRVDVSAMLERYVDLRAHPLAPAGRHEVNAVPTPLPAAMLPRPRDEGGYGVGRQRRAAILADAMQLFASEGFGDTSMRDIANRVGVSKATLFHHFGSKDALLEAVLIERDARVPMMAATLASGRASELLRALPGGVANDMAEQPGLIELCAVLSGESTPASHPGHAYFVERYEMTLAYFTALFSAAAADGDLAPRRDPADEALWFVALWDGLQLHWLYDQEHVDISAQLRLHLTDVLAGASAFDRTSPACGVSTE